MSDIITSMETATLSQADKAFYPTFGPFLVSADVRQATGSAMTSEPTHRWTLARQGKTVRAFATIVPHKNGNGEFSAVYAVDGDEDAKRAVVEASLADAKAQGLKEVRVLVKLQNADFYRALGFADGPLRGQFRQFTKAL